MGKESKKHKKHKKRAADEDEDGPTGLNIDEDYVEGDVPPPQLRLGGNLDDPDREGGAKKAHKHKHKHHKKKDKKRRRENDDIDANDDSTKVSSAKRHRSDRHEQQHINGDHMTMPRLASRSMESGIDDRLPSGEGGYGENDYYGSSSAVMSGAGSASHGLHHQFASSEDYANEMLARSQRFSATSSSQGRNQPRRDHYDDSDLNRWPSGNNDYETGEFPTESTRKRGRREMGGDNPDYHHSTRGRSPPALRSNVEEQHQQFNGSSVGEESFGGNDVQQSGDISLSIDETNRLRAKLGLAPLKMDNQKAAGAGGGDDEPMDPNTYEGWEGKFIHNPADSITAKKEQEKLREKLAAQKRKREIRDKMTKYKGLGEEDPAVNSVAAWVSRSRQLEDQKRLADQRAKALQEMDDDFGIGGLIDEEQSKADLRSKAQTQKSTADGLAGLTVEHSKDTFMEGEDVILVLKDKDILDESEGEVLVNPTLAEHEVWAKNAELRKKKTGYNPYEEELDPFAAPKDVLSKYDDDVDNPHKSSFRLEAGGSVDTSDERIKARIREDLRKQTVTLDSKPLALATEYLTKDEMTTFKKPKKKIKKIRKRAVLKADDLLAENIDSQQDLGSRNNRRRQIADESDKREEGEVDEDMDIDGVNGVDAAAEPKLRPDFAVKPDIDNDDDLIGPLDSDEDIYSGPIEEDEAQNELSMAILRTRRLNSQVKVEPDKAVVSLVTRIDPNGIKKEIKEERDSDNESNDGNEEGGDIVLSTISEYCRGLGDIPTFGMSGNRLDNEMVEEQDESSSESEDEAASAAFPQSQSTSNDGLHRPDIPGDLSGMDSTVPSGRTDPHDAKPSKSARSGWVKADFEGLGEEPATSSGAVLEEGAAILDEESLLDSGVGSALRLAIQKGLFEKEKQRKFSHGKCEVLLSKSHLTMDKQYQDIDDKYARKMDRLGMGGPIVDFNEKKEYKPEFTLEYADSKGRTMDKKEAFNYLSWKFHGKKPGKKKLERIARRHMHDRILKEMTSCDTPLGTLDKQQQKQKSLQQPYLVLTGQGMKDAGLMTSVIKKE